LHKFLGSEYESVVRFTIADAFADSFRVSGDAYLVQTGKSLSHEGH
jgi:hypothetical protein